MSLITPESLKKLSFKTEKLDVPEFGGHINLRKFSVKISDEVADLHKDLEEPGRWKNAILSTVILGVVDDSGVPIFTDEHKTILEEQDSDVITKIYQALTKFNGMSKSEAEAGDAAVKP